MVNRTCTVQDCQRPYKARGWCHTHYEAERRNGRIAVAERLPTWERFCANVDFFGDCWQYDPRKISPVGYGIFSVNRQQIGAHRYIWETLVGKIPENMQIDHMCRNRGCVNPDHMEVVTLAENVLRGEGVTAKNARKTHCVRNHEFTEENTRYRIGPNGKTWRKCRACAREDRAIWREKQRTQDVDRRSK